MDINKLMDSVITATDELMELDGDFLNHGAFTETRTKVFVVSLKCSGCDLEETPLLPPSIYADNLRDNHWECINCGSWIVFQTEPSIVSAERIDLLQDMIRGIKPWSVGFSDTILNQVVKVEN